MELSQDQVSHKIYVKTRLRKQVPNKAGNRKLIQQPLYKQPGQELLQEESRQNTSSDPASTGHSILLDY